ncbi:hypothetical protein [Janthinobacterium sp.]|uniref:hypothetical protein n=1 Tax=Janthinobacterium sp. TaxID=1871054 RepID=UPI00293D281E|nr:hypothetical protein [Janthinobacterium sp.]
MLKLYDTPGCPLERQRFTWRELVQQPISKLDDDAFTRLRVILMSGIENEAVRFQHMAARMNGELRLALAEVRRAEQHQATAVACLLGSDHSPLETTIAYEQLAVELTAALALREPDAYLAQVYRFGLPEHLDHLYRYSALLDRLEGKDANNILQSYTDILPGRPTRFAHRAPADDLRLPYERATAAPLSKMHALTLGAAAYQARDYYMGAGAQFSDPLARQLYAEIASIEEQHLTQYSAMLDPAEGWLEQWLLHEGNEVYNYYGCALQESNPRVRALWERFLDYELGHFHLVCGLFKRHARRDPAEVLPTPLPEAIALNSHRDFIRRVLQNETGLRARGAQFVDKKRETARSKAYRAQMNRDGSPSDSVAAGYAWVPGTELNRSVIAID